MDPLPLFESYVELERIVPAFLGWEDPGAAFTAITQEEYPS